MAMTQQVLLDMGTSPYQLLPPLTDEEYESLKQSIIETGVQVAVEVDEYGNVIDGHHRVRICEELGLEYPTHVTSGLTEQEKRSKARTLNTLRRHLSQAQKRMVIADELRENPTQSNNAIAKRLGVSDSTVGLVRAELGEEVESEWREGADGKMYPARHRTTEVRPVEGSSLDFLEQFKERLPEYDEPAVPRMHDPSSFEIPTTRYAGPQYFSVAWALLEADRDVVMAAVKRAKKDYELANQADAIVAICQEFLDGRA